MNSTAKGTLAYTYVQDLWVTREAPPVVLKLNLARRERKKWFLKVERWDGFFLAEALLGGRQIVW